MKEKEVIKIDRPGFFISEEAMREMKEYDPTYKPIRKEKYKAREIQEIEIIKNWTKEDWQDWDKRMEEFVKDFEE